MLEPSRRFPENVARRVLAKAIELDAAERASLTEHELRSIAAELGIRQASLQLALQEVANERSMEENTPRRSLWVPITASTLGLVLGIAGAVACLPSIAVLTNGALPTIVLGIVEVASGALVVYADDDDHFHFQRTNAALWSAVAAGIAGAVAILGRQGVFIYSSGYLLTWAFVGWIVSSLVGGGAIAVRSRRAAHADQIGGSTRGGLQGVLKVARSLGERIKSRWQRFKNALFVSVFTRYRRVARPIV